jgi:16S rRNA (cytosine1402-N4)-methyltransferase
LYRKAVVKEPGGHTPVLAREVCELLGVRGGEIVVDAAIGPGGHARLFADGLGAEGTLIGVDVDPDCLAAARRVLGGASCRVELIHANFTELRERLESLGIAGVDVLFADLGISSTQLDDPERGFSFQRDGPLDMRMDPRLTVTAADLVNRLKERELADLLYHNAQEFASRRIARKICAERREGRITTTGRLAGIIADAVGVDPASRKAKIHPATRTFQAIRMAINDEICCLETLLEAAPKILRPGGRIGVIAFHSGEDKPVKLSFRKLKNQQVYKIVTEKPVVADAEERLTNPRSRSAKLRVAVRLSDEESAPGIGN